MPIANPQRRALGGLCLLTALTLSLPVTASAEQPVPTGDVLVVVDTFQTCTPIKPEGAAFSCPLGGDSELSVRRGADLMIYVSGPNVTSGGGWTCVAGTCEFDYGTVSGEDTVAKPVTGGGVIRVEPKGK